MVTKINATQKIIDSNVSDENPIPSPNSSTAKRPTTAYAMELIKPIFLPSFNPSLAKFMIGSSFLSFRFSSCTIFILSMRTTFFVNCT